MNDLRTLTINYNNNQGVVKMVQLCTIRIRMLFIANIMVLIFILSIVLLSIGTIRYMASYNNCEAIYNNKFNNLKIEKKQYGKTFELNDNLKSLIENIVVLHDEYDENSDIDNSFQERFVSCYLKNGIFGFDYLYNAYKNDGNLSRQQIEYIYWSMTAKYVTFDSISSETIDINDTSIGSSYGELVDYSFTTSADGISLNGMVEIHTAGYIGTRKYAFIACLKENPYSCFDGYSIVSIVIEDKTPDISPDYKVHTIRVLCMGDDYSDGKADVEVTGSNDDLLYNHFITLNLSDNRELLNFVKQNEDEKLVVEYVLDSSQGMYISEIVPKKITVYN